MSSARASPIALLGTLRRRVHAQMLVRNMAIAALLTGGWLVLHGVVNRWVFERMPWDPRFAFFSIAAALFGALLFTLFCQRRSLQEVAIALDCRGQTRDRLLTALTFARSAPDENAMRLLAAQECERFFAARDFRNLLPWRLPREIIWLFVPATTLLMLQWEARDEFARREEQRSEARAHIEQTAAALEQLARTSERADPNTQSEELRRIGEELKKSAQKLRAEVTTKEQAEKARLSALSELESMLQEMQKSSTNISIDERKELAGALAQHDVTKDAAKAIEAGNFQQAARIIEDAARKEDPATAEKMREALREALERLAEKRKLSEQLAKLAQQLQQRAGAASSASQLLQQLAELLRQMPSKQQGQQNTGGQQQSLTQLLTALQNLKFGEDGQPQPGKEGSAKEGTPRIAIESFSGSDPKADMLAGERSLPSGQPGSERDTGTTATPFGEKRGTEGAKGADISVLGRIGEGESLSTLLPAAGDQTASRTRYKELYQAMAPAAEEAILQENIPLGSRFFIKRYFEAIRPPE